MTPLPGPLGGSDIAAWRLDEAMFAATWDNGEGAYRAGGRWNSVGVRAVYCAIDPATAILEVAVHKGFKTLDAAPHILTSMSISEPSQIYVIDPESLPNPSWLGPGTPSAGQQEFGDALLAQHKFVVAPSVVSTRSWNLIFVGSVAAGAYTVRSRERFALDTRLHPPAARKA